MYSLSISRIAQSIHALTALQAFTAPNSLTANNVLTPDRATALRPLIVDAAQWVAAQMGLAAEVNDEMITIDVERTSRAFPQALSQIIRDKVLSDIYAPIDKSAASHLYESAESAVRALAESAPTPAFAAKNATLPKITPHY